MMTKTILYITITSLLLFSCNSTDKPTVENETIPANLDTTISLTINSVQKTFVVSKELRLDLNKFQAFLNKYPSIPLVYIDTLNTDINGDGIDEQTISKIENKKGDCIIYSSILMGNNIIRQDTLKPNNDLAFMDWASDSIYYKLKPYSSFYDALLQKNVVEDLEKGKIDEGLIEFYINGTEARLKDKGHDAIFVKTKIDSITNELRNYKGKIVTTLEHWDRSILIWNKAAHDFELLYTP